jgi:type II secretory pathway component GspD/PulD (secretin)
MHFCVMVLSVVVCLMLGQVQVLAGDAIIDMSFKQADVEDVFRTIAKAGGMNLLTGRDVSGKITLDLENVSIMTALDTVARLTGYAYVVVDDIVIVATSDTIEEQFTDKYFTVYDPKGISIQDAAEIARVILSSRNVTVVGNRLVMYGTDIQFEILKDILSQVDEQPEEVSTFDDATVFDLLRAISVREGYALVVDPQIADSKVTMDIGMIDSVSALDILSEWYGLDYELENGILKVRRKLEPVPVISQESIEVPEPELTFEMPVVSVISTHYITARDVKGMIEKLYPVSVTVETIGEHMTVVKGFACDIEEIAGLVHEMDRPNAQVMVEVRVQEVSLNALEELGLSWTLPIVSAGREEGEAKVLSVNYSNFEIALNALVRSGKSKLLARPSISSVEGEKARVFIGERIPIVLKSQSEEGTSESISYFESGVLLEITPEVISDGLITLVVESQISTITGYTSDNHPKIRTRETQTKVRVADGQPIVIGGLLKQEDVSEDDGIPF